MNSQSPKSRIEVIDMSINIFDAVLQEDEDQLKSLIMNKVDLNPLDEDGRTPLIHSVIDGMYEFIQLLLENGANVNVSDELGYTALHYAAQSYDLKATQLLLENGAKVDILDNHGNTPLFRAVFNSAGRGDVIKILLAHGADKHLKNNHGVSPYELAETIGNYDVVQYLK